MKSRGRTKGYNGTNLAKGLAAGIIGGLVASWTMNQFQALIRKLEKEMEKSSDRRKKKKEPDAKEGDDATVKAASAISENVFDHKLTKSEKKSPAPPCIMHSALLRAAYMAPRPSWLRSSVWAVVYLSARSSGSQPTKLRCPRSVSRRHPQNIHFQRTLPRSRRMLFTD